MKTEVVSRFTAQDKMVMMNKKLGNVGMKNMQGTSRVIYDSILIEDQQSFEFFTEVAAKKFPFTNVSSTVGGVMSVGETMIAERLYFFGATIDAATGEVTSIFSVFDASPNLQKGDWTMTIANQIVVKPLPLTSSIPQFNKNAFFDNYNNFEMDTMLGIPPLLGYSIDLRIPFPLLTLEPTYLFCVTEGAGAILNTKENY